MVWHFHVECDFEDLRRDGKRTTTSELFKWKEGPGKWSGCTLTAGLHEVKISDCAGGSVQNCGGHWPVKIVFDGKTVHWGYNGDGKLHLRLKHKSLYINNNAYRWPRAVNKIPEEAPLLKIPANVLGTALFRDGTGKQPDEKITTASVVVISGAKAIPKNEVFNNWIAKVQNTPERKTEMAGGKTRQGNGVIQYGQFSMRFYFTTKGRPDRNGKYPCFICLHGGGGCPASTNDGQWNAMKNYWAPLCSSGVYIAPRGITNSWKLHWEDASFPCYDRIIENAIAFLDVDPNRVYMMGYSAGGDGVYRIVPVLSDRFAAGNMCAGHHNYVNFVNFINTPMRAQCGELDTAYSRHKLTAEFGMHLQKLRGECMLRRQKLGLPGVPHDAHGPPYHCEALIHREKRHSGIPDWGRTSSIVHNCGAWVSEGCSRGQCGGTKSLRCDSIGWSLSFQRNPIPDYVMWNPNVSPVRDPPAYGEVPGPMKKAKRHQLHYWLDISIGKWPYDASIIEATLHKTQNMSTITLHQCGSRIRVLINDTMISSGCQKLTLNVAPNAFGTSKASSFSFSRFQFQRNIQERTMAERGDPNFCFGAEVSLACGKNGQWICLSVVGLIY